MSNPYATKARPGDASGHGSSEDDAESAYPIPGTNVVVGVDADVEQAQLPYGFPIPLGIQPPQRTTLDPQTGSDSQIAGEPTPSFVEGPGSGVVDEFPDAWKMHQQTLDMIDAGSRRIVKALTYEGTTIVPLIGGGAIVQQGFAPTSHLRLRVRAILASRATAGVANLVIGTEQYGFDLAAGVPVMFPFPLVIERGADLSFTGDGRCYLFCDVE